MIDDHNHPASCGSDPVLTSLQSVAGRGFKFLCVQHSVKHVLGPREQMLAADESKSDGQSVTCSDGRNPDVSLNAHR